jgi:hypothetical protein
MKKTITIAALVLSLSGSAACAGERGGDAALGAISGAVVFGPIGAVAGAVVGYTAGPGIAHAWGVRRSGSAHPAPRSARHEAPASPGGGQPTQAGPPQARTPTPAPRQAASVTPPVQTLE